MPLPEAGLGAPADLDGLPVSQTLPTVSYPVRLGQRSLGDASRRGARRVQDHVHRVVGAAGLVDSQLIVVAVSGGGDSLVLLDALINVRARGGPQLHIAHFNHSIRPDSDCVAAAVAARAQALNLPVTVGESESDLSERPAGLSLEMAAREHRWRFLRRVAEPLQAARIATGHTEDDQVETIMMNLARGAGPRGLAGMRTDDGEILRPILDITGDAVDEYLSAQKLTPDDDDPSNATSDFRRNRIRHELIPLLEGIYPGSRKAVARAAWLSGRRGTSTDFPVASSGNARMPVHPERVGVPPGPLVDVIRVAAERMRPDYPPLNAIHIAALTTAMRPPSRGGWVQLPAGLWAFVRAGAVVLYPKKVWESAMLESYPLVVPGVTRIPGARVFADTVDRADIKSSEVSVDSVYIDGDRRGSGMLLRGIASGEAFQPLGSPQARDIGRFIASRGIPSALRAGTPVVTVGGKLAWIVGVEMANDFAVHANTNQATRMDVIWDSPPVPSDLWNASRVEI